MNNIRIFLFAICIISVHTCSIKDNTDVRSHQPILFNISSELHLFCPKCKRNQSLWNIVNEALKNYENKTAPEYQPRKFIPSRNYSRAKQEFEVKTFPALVLFDTVRKRIFTLNIATEVNSTKIQSWLANTTTEMETYWKSYHLTDKTFVPEIVNSFSNETISLILLKNSQYDKGCEKFNANFMHDFRRKHNDRKHASQINVYQMDISISCNYQFLRETMRKDLTSFKCPIFVKIKEFTFEILKSSKIGDNDRLLQDRLSAFIDAQFTNETAETLKLSEQTSNRNYEGKFTSRSEEDKFYDKQYQINEKLKDKTFTAIGITGGLSVIALAVSIFWGLKSSSFGAKPGVTN